MTKIKISGKKSTPYLLIFLLNFFQDTSHLEYKYCIRVGLRYVIENILTN